jgi:FlaA1/EpsC-like NDP-sugar epimerase
VTISHPSEGSWQRFLTGHEPSLDPHLYREQIAGRTVLVTGAGGWIGSALCDALAARDATHLILIDLAENALYQAQRALVRYTQLRVTAILGSVRDAVCVHKVLAEHKPDVVYHAAAYKHVPLAEQNPFTVVDNNALGSATLVRAAAAYRVPRVVMVSTDKAVDPASIMGASKRLAELALFRHNASYTMSALRLGNVFGSPGSVAPLFHSQIEAGGPITVTDPDARRYVLSLADVTRYLLAALAAPAEAELLLPELGEPLRVADLARSMVGDRTIPIVFAGLRPGDKREEALLASKEVRCERILSDLWTAKSPHAEAQLLDQTFDSLQQAIVNRDMGSLVTGVKRLVPEYTPSSVIQQQVAVACVVHH